MSRLRTRFRVSERRACRVVGQPRATQRYVRVPRADEDRLTEAVVALAGEYGRYGYRRITALLQGRGWKVGCDRPIRITSGATTLCTTRQTIAASSVF